MGASFLEYLEKVAKQKGEVRESIKSMLAVKQADESWRGVIAVPPGSMLEKILSKFKRETDIPLELPFFALMHFISGYLLSKRVKINGNKFGSFYPELWTIVLAESGRGKTFAHNIIADASPIKSTFPECNSGAKFIAAFEENNFGLWFQDEIAQKMKQIDSPNSNLADVKEYLLRAYGNDKIERATKHETITIEEPCIGILGLNTPESFMKSISPESMLDGFMQRFSFVVAEPDPNRDVRANPYKYSTYNEEALKEVAKAAFERLQQIKIHPVYKLGADAEEAYRVSFEMLMTDTMPISFFRRVMYKSFKYALLYHIILGKETDTIDAEDIGWGARVSTLHLQDLKHLVCRDDMAKVTDYIEKAKKVKAKFEKDGKKCTARDLYQNIRGLDAAGGKALMTLLSD